jgi:predicted permease
VYVFLPCNTFTAFAGNFTIDYIQNNYAFLLISIGATVVIAVSAFFLAKTLTKKDYERRVHEYSLTTPNFAYMGYAMAESLFGAVGLCNFIVYTLPLLVYGNTYGFSRLTQRSLSWKKVFNPPTIAMILGGVWGILGLPLPNVAWSVLDKAKVCMAPCSMLLLGIAVSELPLKELLNNKNVYIVSVLRLLVIPLAIGGILQLFFSQEIVKIAVLAYVMPCGLNTIVFPKLIGEDCRSGAGLALLSTVLACLTIPLVMWIFGVAI